MARAVWGSVVYIMVDVRSGVVYDVVFVFVRRNIVLLRGRCIEESGVEVLVVLSRV